MELESVVFIINEVYQKINNDRNMYLTETQKGLYEICKYVICEIEL